MNRIELSTLLVLDATPKSGHYMASSPADPDE